MSTIKYLVSACLAGAPCRYDGKDNLQLELKALVDEGRAIAFCPEVEGGLKTPRTPCELQYRDGALRVISKDGNDCTEAFLNGANKALELCKKHNITKAILKANSPSCGNQTIYDGTFSKTLIPGAGICAKRLQDHNIDVTNEHDWSE